MRKLIMTLSAASLVVPVATVLPVEGAAAKRHYEYREWRGRDGRTYCRKSDGTTGLVIGGVGGAVLGNAVGGGLLGTIGGAAAGALAGRAIDRTTTAKKRCS